MKVLISNTGDIKTSEVVQVYMRSEDPNEVRNTRLAGFARVTADAGENALVEIPISPDSFKVVNDAGEKVTARGKTTFYVGFGQPDERTLSLTGKKSFEFTI